MSEVPRDVLIWIVVGLIAWLAIFGVLTAQVLGAVVDASEPEISARRSRRRRQVGEIH